MHHALGNALVVEVEDFLAEMEVLDQRWAALTDLQGVLVVGYRTTLRGGENLCIALGDLVQFAAVAANELLIVNAGCLAGGCLGWGAGHGISSLVTRTNSVRKFQPGGRLRRGFGSLSRLCGISSDGVFWGNPPATSGMARLKQRSGTMLVSVD
jgi:hypothetical protein